MRRSRTVTASTLVSFLGLAAGLATFGGRKTAFLKKRLIGSGEGKILPAIAACELHVSGHKKSPFRTPCGAIVQPIS